MKTIEKEVRKFKRTNGIKGIPNLHELKDIILKKYGFTTYGYHKDEEKLHETKTYEHSLDRPAFTYCKNGKRHVFYNDLLSETDITHVLAHELGHLYYDHLHRHIDSADTPIRKEWQANIFAAYLMEPKNYKTYLKKSILPVALVATSFFCGTLVPQEPATMTSFPEEAAVTTSVSSPITVTEETPDAEQNQVYVAAHGTVYHISENCSYIKGNAGIQKMALESAKDANLPLCSRCRSKMGK